MEWEWQYEPEGFSREWGWGDEIQIVRYLPDFYLPQTETWVERKPISAVTKAAYDAAHQARFGT